jgi:hypothetical protein
LSAAGAGRGGGRTLNLLLARCSSHVCACSGNLLGSVPCLSRDCT